MFHELCSAIALERVSFPNQISFEGYFDGHSQKMNTTVKLLAFMRKEASESFALKSHSQV